MDTPESIRQKIYAATTAEDADVRASFLAAFEAEIAQFVEGMANAFDRWQRLDDGCAVSFRHACASALVYSAITLHISSMNLFLSGWLVAAGNIQRQVLESIALGFLVSAPRLQVLEAYSAGRYSSSKAPAQLLRHRKTLGLNEEGVAILRRAASFYHNWSHANLMTVATHIQAQGHDVYVGAAFDEGRLEQYRQEAQGRASLAEIFENCVIGVQSLIDRAERDGA